MSIFDFLKRTKYPDKHELIQEERETGGETQAIKVSLKRLRAELEMEKIKLEAERDRIRIQAEIEKARQDLEDLQGDDEDYEEDGGGRSTEDALMTMLLSKVMGGQQQPAPQITQAAPAPAPKVDLEDQQIAGVWNSLSKHHQQIAKRMNDDQLKVIIEANLPGISDASLTRAVAFVRKV